MEEHYDLDAILQRDWETLGPKLQGKIHLYVGDADTYFLNDAVYLMEDFLKTTGTPGHGVPYEGEVKYGPRAEHCWNGDPTLPNAYSRLHYNTMYLPQIMERIEKTAPAGCGYELEVLKPPHPSTFCSGVSPFLRMIPMLAFELREDERNGT